MREAALELSELLEQANRLKDSIPELADTDEFTDRTVYYYAQQGLLPRASRRRGPGTRYPADFVDRLLFIRRLQKEQSLTLANIREVMDSVSPRTIHEVGRGIEPLEIRIGGDYAAADVDRHSEALALDSPLNMMSDDFDRTKFSGRGETVAARTAALRPTTVEDSSDNRGTYGGRYRVGSDAELTVNKPLTPLQEKRVEQVVGLLKSILEDEG